MGMCDLRAPIMGMDDLPYTGCNIWVGPHRTPYQILTWGDDPLLVCGFKLGHHALQWVWTMSCWRLGFLPIRVHGCPWPVVRLLFPEPEYAQQLTRGVVLG